MGSVCSRLRRVASREQQGRQHQEDDDDEVWDGRERSTLYIGGKMNELHTNIITVYAVTVGVFFVSMRNCKPCAGGKVAVQRELTGHI